MTFSGYRAAGGSPAHQQQRVRSKVGRRGPAVTDKPPGYSAKIWARLQPGERRAALVRYWEGLPVETQRMLAKKYGAI